MKRKRKPARVGLDKQVVRSVGKKAKKRGVVDFISSGCTSFDLILGGGFPLRKIVNLVGDKSTGKTLLVSEFIAKAKSIYGKKLKWYYDDAEVGYSFDSKDMYGFDIITEKSTPSFLVDDFTYNITKELAKLKKDELLIYVLDTLDALVPREEVKEDTERMKAIKRGSIYDKGSYGMGKPKEMSKFFRLRRKQIKDKKCILIIVSQVRANIGVMFGKKFSRTGGMALDFYAAQVIWLAEVDRQKKKNRAIGITIKAKVDKNKVGKPFRECYMNILFDYGVDNISTNIESLYNLRTDKGKLKERKDKIKWDGKSYGMRGLIRHIEKEGLEEELNARVIEKWNEVEDSISSKGRKGKY